MSNQQEEADTGSVSRSAGCVQANDQKDRVLWRDGPREAQKLVLASKPQDDVLCGQCFGWGCETCENTGTVPREA